MKFKYPLIASALLVILVFLAACGGSTGEEGPVGPQGPPGPQGPAGPPGDNATGASDYVGSQKCGSCHDEIYQVFEQTGHFSALTAVVNGQPPDFPFSELPSPPEGFSWDDISYVIGGFNWKARFVDQDGYMVTGAANATTQYNLYNSVLKMGDEWVAYHAGEEQLPFSCGECHTTGYRAQGNQDGLPGVIGTWAESGVMCERCHGPGSQHVVNPYGFAMKIERDAELCGECHSRGDVEQVDATDGFIQHHEQYEELFQSKHLVLDCVTCHDPHTLVVQQRQNDLPTTRTSCENCHYKEKQYQAVDNHAGFKVQCIDCHMPRVTKSAEGDPSIFSGDLRTHVMAIDPFQIGQFSEDGTVALSQISLDFACRGCHNPNGFANPKTDEELINAAFGYHDITPPQGGE